MVQSIHLVCLSVAPFSLCSNHRIIMKFSRVTYNYRRDVLTKGQGKRSKVKVTDRAGVKYVLSNTGTRGETIRFGHDTIRFMIHSWPYDTFHDTFLVLGLKAETYNFGLSSGAPHSTCYCCLSSNHAQWLHQWRPLRSFHVLNFCVEYARFIGIYWLLFVGISHQFLTIVRDRTASYFIFISLSVSWYVSSAQIYQYIGNMMNRFTPNKYKIQIYTRKWSFELPIQIFCSALIQIQIHRFKYRYKKRSTKYICRSLPLCISGNFTGTGAVAGHDGGGGGLGCWVGMRSTVRWLETPYM